jgi:uncharacterized OB-fold protein
MKGSDFETSLFPQSVDSIDFWAGCNQGRLLLQWCSNCRRAIYFPRRLCPFCGQSDLHWHQASGLGTIYSHSEVHTPIAGPKWASQLPYTVVLVDLREGPRMASRLIGEDRHAVSIGDRVEVCFVEVSGQKLPFFCRVSSV